MLPWMSLLLACEREEEERPIEPETDGEPQPHFLASLTLQGTENNDLTVLWLDLGGAPAPLPEIEIERCQLGRRWDTPPVMNDAGDLTVQVGLHTFSKEDFVENDGAVNLGEDYPTGFPIRFEASGGSHLPAFQVPELVVVPAPLVELSVGWEGDGVRFEWTSEGDSADTLLVLGADPWLTCRVEDDGSFLVSAEDLAALDPNDLNVGWLIRSRTWEVIDGEVLVRGTARYLVIDTL